MSARTTRHLVIFTRRPRYGLGKRRLAAEVGELAAWRFQRFSLERLTRRLTGDPRWTSWLALTPDRPRAPSGRLSVLPQGSGDLGARLRRVARQVPPGPLVIIGSDAPQICRADIAQAFKALGGSDAAIGPALDGGYWLLGLSIRGRRRPPFANIRWSTRHAFDDTLRALRGRAVALLRPLEDVDDAASLARADLIDTRFR